MLGVNLNLYSRSSSDPGMYVQPSKHSGIVTSEDEELAHSRHSNHTHRPSGSVVGGSHAVVCGDPVDTPGPGRSDSGAVWEVVGSSEVHDAVMRCQ